MFKVQVCSLAGVIENCPMIFQAIFLASIYRNALDRSASGLLRPKSQHHWRHSSPCWKCLSVLAKKVRRGKRPFLNLKGKYCKKVNLPSSMFLISARACLSLFRLYFSERICRRAQTSFNIYIQNSGCAI